MGLEYALVEMQVSGTLALRLPLSYEGLKHAYFYTNPQIEHQVPTTERHV